MALKFKRRLFQHLSHNDYVGERDQSLIHSLSISEEDREEFLAALKEFVHDKLITVSHTGFYNLPSIADYVSRGNDEIEGTFKKALRGFGFVKTAQQFKEGEIFVPEDDTANALSGDTVVIKLIRDHKRERQVGGGPQFTGRIVEISKRKRSGFAGIIEKRGTNYVVHPDGKEIRGPIVVRDASSKNVKDGDKVIIEIMQYPEGNMVAEGVIVKVLGEAGRPDVETEATIAAFDLPGEHDEECVEQAREATLKFKAEMERYDAEGPSALGKRLDLTEDYIITIDPPDAKDYDDAISIRRSDRIQGGWELSIHIADVAHFIPRNSPLDIEARDRANSVYLPRHVIPMLPEVLSNGICSLQEGVPRYCKSAIITYDRDGNVKGEGVAQVLIKSTKRLTYLEAQALIDGDQEEAKKHAKTPPIYTDKLISTLKDMNFLAKAIQGRRQRQGMISLELPACVLIYDENGKVVDAEKEDDAFTHTLIEMFMVEANEVLARLFEKLDVPLLRRIHPEPIPGDIDQLRKASMVAGYKIPQKPTREELQGLVNATRGTPAARAVHMAVLRTLSKAEYSPALVGHFALASNAYAHFTSPIRRYADLTVHRALAEYLKLTDNGQNPPHGEAEWAKLGNKLGDKQDCLDEKELLEIGQNATTREINASDAEDSLRRFLVLQLLSTHLGEEFPGVITGVNVKGVFVQLDKYVIDGFVKSTDLPGDTTRENLTPFWKLDPRSGALVDEKSGRSYNMGDSVKVKIVSVDLPRREMELVVSDGTGRAVGKIKLGGPLGGGMGGGKGIGFGSLDSGRGMTGSQRRSAKSKKRDKNKGSHRRDA